MGLFSSKKKTTVHTSVMRVVDDEHMPDTLRRAVLKGILGDQGSIPEHIVEDLLNSSAIKVDRFYEQAQKTAPYGLPHGSLLSDVHGQAIVKTYLERLHGQTITLDYYHFAPINNMHIGWQKLTEDYGYFAGTNEVKRLSTAKGVPVYLQDLVAFYCDETIAEASPGTLDSFGRPATAGYTPERTAQVRFGLEQFLQVSDYQYDPASAIDYVRATVVWWIDGVKHTDQLFFSLAGYDYEGDYYQVEYRLNGALGQTHYLTYLNESGVIPELDQIFRIDYAELGSYFPWTYCRFNKENQGDKGRHSSTAYKNTVKLCKLLDLDYQDLCNSVQANPDVDDIEQAMLVFAVPANADTAEERRYLYDYFNALYYADVRPAQSLGNFDSGLTRYSFKGGRSILIQDRRFRMTLAYSGLVKRKVAGKLGKVGTYTSGRGHYSSSGPIPLGAAYHYYRHQVSSTFYEEVAIVQPQLTFHIYGKYTYTAGAGDAALLIPLDRAISQHIPLVQREDLYLRSLHMVFNSRVVTKTKWYQSGIFKVVMVVIAVVIAIASGGAGSFVAALTTAAAAGVSALAITVVTLLMQSFLATYAFKLIAEKLGPEFAMVLAVGAAIYGGMSAYEAGSFSASTTAQTMLKASTGLVKASSAEYVDNLRTEYAGDLSQFQLYVDESNKALKEMKKLLDVSIPLDPFSFIGEVPLMSLGEAPDAYYMRTVHAGNIGVMGVNAISSYVDMSLTLPDMNQTLGELNNV